MLRLFLVIGHFGLVSTALAGLSGDLQKSCQSLTYDVDYKGLSGIIPGPRFYNSLQSEPQFSPEQSPSRSFIGQSIEANPWVWAKIPHAQARRPAIYLTFSQWFSGMAPIFQPRHFAGFPNIERLPNNPLTATYGELDEAIDTFFEDETLYSNLLSGSGPVGLHQDYRSPEELKALLSRRYSAGEAKHEINFDHYRPQDFQKICAIFQPFNFLDCGKSAYRQASHLLTGGARSLGGKSLIPILTTTDQRVGETAYKIAKTLLNKYRSGKVDSDLMTVTRSAFLNAGFSPTEAENWTWDFILLVFIHGQNTALELRSKHYVQTYNFWTIFSADLVSTLSVYFDSVRLAKSEALFSFPSDGVRSTCDNGKPYHFWVAAYSARGAQRAGDTPSSASWGAYSLEVGYQMFAGTYGRNPLRDLKEGAYSTWNARNRLDLAYAAAGALYGARVETPLKSRRPYSIDRSYLALYQTAGRLFRPGHTTLERAVKDPDLKWLHAQQWISMMSPGTGMRSLIRPR